MTNLIDPTGTKVPELATAQSKLLLEAKTLMQKKDDIYKLFNRKDNPKVNFVALEYRNEILSAKASQMLIDLTNEKEFLDNITDLDREEKIEIGEILFELIINRLKEINSAIEILERK